MQDLLPYYERELAYLRRYGREFAERYPKIAGRLQLSAEGSQDPHVERLIEAFALLGARISKRIEDDYPEFTEALLEVLYPHYLRPFPSCSIACFDLGAAAARLSGPRRVPRGSLLQSREVRGVQCSFRTAYDVWLSPLRLQAASYLAVAEAPLAVSLPAGSGGQISLQLVLESSQLSFADLADQVLRFFIDGEASFSAALRDALSLDVHAAYVEADGSGIWRRLPTSPLRAVGFAENEALLEVPARSHPAYRLLTEWFAFPDKFGFMDLPLHEVSAGAARACSLHLVLKAKPAGHGAAAVLEALEASHLKLGCTPIVNLFSQAAEPIQLTEREESYPVVVNARHAFGYEVYSIDAVYRVRQTPQGESIQSFRPFYALQHGEDPVRSGRYWLARRDPDLARRSPGYETLISFVDLDFDPLPAPRETISLQLTCSNRELPAQLAYGVPGGDLSLEGEGAGGAIVLLRKPTLPQRFPRGKAVQWRLISHLSLNRLSLSGSGLAAFKEMLRLYEISGSRVAARQIDGILGLEPHPVGSWLQGPQFASMVRGLEMRLTVRESHFVGTGLAAFAQVLDHFFALYVHANSFTRLVLISGETGEEIVRCPPRSGESILA